MTVEPCSTNLQRESNPNSTTVPNGLILEWGTFYLLIADFFATKNIDGAKELVIFF